MEIGIIETEDYQIYKTDDETHIIPVFAAPKSILHEITVKCWCCPRLDFIEEETENKHWLHSSVN